jgi:DNA-binding CsgD family transcriptional regulator
MFMDDQPDDHKVKVIRQCCEAAARPELWPAALQKLADSFQAEGCVVTGGPCSSIAPIWSSGIHENLPGAASLGCIENNVCAERTLLAFKQGRDIVVGETNLSPTELDRHQGNAQFNANFGPRWFAATTLAGAGPNSVILNLLRRAEAKPFSEHEIDSLRRIRPRLQEAADSALHFAAIHHEALLEAFSVFEYGVLLLDLKGRVLKLNNIAERLLSPALTVAAGFLRARTPKSDALLQKIIRSVTAAGTAPVTECRHTVAINRVGASPLLFHAAPLLLSGADRLRQARAVLTIIDRDTFRAQQITNIRKTFSLTKSEAEVAVALASGHDVDEIAAMRQVGIGTLRAQLRSIFTKTHTRRQSELVVLILSSGGPL